MKHKVFSVMMAVGMLLSILSMTACQESDSDHAVEKDYNVSAPLELKEIVIQEWKESGGIDTTARKEHLLFHNNGNPIQTDLFKDGEQQDSFLIAVYLYEENDAQTIGRFFSNEAKNDMDETIERVEKAVNNRQNPEKCEMEYGKSANSIGDTRFNDFEYKESGYVIANLTNTFSFVKENADVDGKAGSLWDVAACVQLEKVNAAKLKELYTRLSVAQEHQRMVSWGRKENRNAGKTEDAGSSLSEGYSCWRSYRPFFSAPVDSFSLEPNIRATNTAGAFVLEFSHVSTMKTTGTAEKDYRTGVIQEWIPDLKR